MVRGIELFNDTIGESLPLHVTETPNFILSSVDWGQVEGNHHTFKFVDQVGVYVTVTSLETRQVNIIGWVVAENEALIGYHKSFLNEFINPLNMIKLQYSTVNGNYVLSFLPNMSVKYAATERENNEYMCKFSILGLCADPLFEDQQFTSVAAVNTIPLFHFPLIISPVPNPPAGIVFGYRQPNLLIPIDNIGAVPVGFEFDFRAAGSLVNPKLTNVTTGEVFQVNKSMVSGEVITVRTVIGSKSIMGKVGTEAQTNYIKYRKFGSKWLQLAKGRNYLTYEADEGTENLEIFFRFTNRYLEVQR